MNLWHINRRQVFWAVLIPFVLLSSLCAARMIIAKPLAGKVIMIDASRGNADLSFTHNDLNEHDINLALCQDLKHKLNELGGKVILAQDCDIDSGQLSPLNEYEHNKHDVMQRAAIAGESDIDVFLTIHICMSRNLEQPITVVYHSLQSSQGKQLAQALEKEITIVMPANIITNEEQPYAMLLDSISVPGAIIEFRVSDPEQDALIREPHRRKLLTEAVANGINRFLSNPIRQMFCF